MLLLTGFIYQPSPLYSPVGEEFNFLIRSRQHLGCVTLLRGLLFIKLAIISWQMNIIFALALLPTVIYRDHDFILQSPLKLEEIVGVVEALGTELIWHHMVGGGITRA